MSTRIQLVEQFEQKLGHQLPEDYRTFLLDGPLPIWQGECDPENQATYILFSLWDLGRRDETDLSVVWDERDTELPDWFLEIGAIYDSVKLGVGLVGNHRGQVYSFSRDNGEPEMQAPSFKVFFERLRADGGSFDDVK